MRPEELEPALREVIEPLVEHFAANHSRFQKFLEQLSSVVLSNDRLKPLIHSTKGRIKDADHLRAKLKRKWDDYAADGRTFDITKENLFHKVNDLTGCRILHMHTRQMAELHNILLDIFEEYRLPLVEAPFARTWDNESRDFFRSIGITTEDSPSLYTSVHYVVESNSRSMLTGEIQVRTLAEEIWGEVDHTINYPTRSTSLACREQIKVLARVTSSCTRLVDSIFASHGDHAEALAREARIALASQVDMPDQAEREPSAAAASIPQLAPSPSSPSPTPDEEPR